MDKLKALSKSIIFASVMLLFLALSAIIAKAMKLSANRTYIFQGSIMLLSLIVPLFYIGSKGLKLKDLGFNKINKKSLISVLFYIPFIIAIALLAIQFKKVGSSKSLVVIFYYFFCLAIAAEVYFRGLIQHFLRDNFHIIAIVAICGILFACCNVYYLYKVTYMKHIAIFIVGSAAFAGVATMLIEKKGNIIFTIILNALYYFMSFNHATSGKKILLGQGICWVVLFAYGLCLLIPYMKGQKEDTNKLEDKEETTPEVEEFEEETVEE